MEEELELFTKRPWLNCVYICFCILFVLYITDIELYTHLILMCTLGWLELTVISYVHCKTMQELSWG